MAARLLRYEQHPDGRRCYLAGRRVHHGLVGLAAAVVGVALMLHDWRDRRVWLRVSDR